MEGAAAVRPAQNDPQLARLLEQTARSVYERYGEPDEGFYCGDELNELATKWVAAAQSRSLNYQAVIQRDSTSGLVRVQGSQLLLNP